MIIQVAENNLFEHEKSYFKKLWANNNAVYEKFEIFRNNILIFSGVIQWVGTHGACPMFTFDKKLNNVKYFDYLEASYFKPGDIISIDTPYPIKDYIILPE